ncbi:MAG: hypothetical protein F6K10_32890 [Moorea sp. SIO2B7]|nr:hypothetical protein [Moorena sp. SIO2B7]
MKYIKIGSLMLISFVTGSLLSWVIRGMYDQNFMMEGYFHVVSNAKQDREIALRFPSGKQVDFTLKKGSSFDFKLSNTGEGSIAIVIDGTLREQVGYVTSMNSMVVLVIGNEQTHFSQVFPSLITEH